MQKTVQSWSELLALPKFKLPGNSRWWKIEPINDDGDMGLWVWLTGDEWKFVAHISEPEHGTKAVIVNSPFGLAFKNTIDITAVKYDPEKTLVKGMSELDKGWPNTQTAYERELRERLSTQHA